MEEIKKTYGIFTAKVQSIYNYQTEVYERQTDQNIKPKKSERSIAVRCYRKKIGYRIFRKKVVYTYLKLHIQELNKTIKINITKFLEKKYNGQKINKKFLSAIKTKIAKEILVQNIDGVWTVINYDNLLLK